VAGDEVEQAAGRPAGAQPFPQRAGEQLDRLLGDARHGRLRRAACGVRFPARGAGRRPGQPAPAGGGRGAPVDDLHGRRRVGYRGGVAVPVVAHGERGQPAQRVAQPAQVGQSPAGDGVDRQRQRRLVRAEEGGGAGRRGELVVPAVPVGPERVHQLDGQRLAEQPGRAVGHGGQASTNGRC
jgi:hypothetical protein